MTQTVVASRSGGGPDRLLSRSDSSSLHTPSPLLPAFREEDPSDVAIRDINPFNNHRPDTQRYRGSNFMRSSEDPAGFSPPNPSSQRKKSSCRDIIEKMAGSLSCSDFLERFGYRYCNHSYVKRNCCASQAIICNKSAKWDHFLVPPAKTLPAQLSQEYAVWSHKSKSCYFLTLCVLGERILYIFWTQTPTFSLTAYRLILSIPANYFSPSLVQERIRSRAWDKDAC